MATMVILEHSYDNGYVVDKQKSITRGPIELLESLADAYMDKLGYSFHNEHHGYSLTYSGTRYTGDYGHRVEITLSDPDKYTQEFWDFHEKGIVPEEYKD